jgi:hypothetical protein
MLSILIPTYNYNAFPLVLELHQQCMDSNLSFEILCFDDASVIILPENHQINSLEYCRYEVLDKNIGRSAIRNVLAKKAKFDNLLFLDSDTIPVHSNFISNYIFQINKGENVVYGGIRYQKEKPDNTQLLRWVYGNSREALSVEKRIQNPHLSFLSLNFLIKKEILNQVKFNESIPNLRHEDSLFSFELKKENIQPTHIENPVYHLGIENSTVFIQKSEESVVGLHHLITSNLIDSHYLRISQYHRFLKKTRLDYFFSKCFNLAKPILRNHLTSKNPSLYIFDLYRLGYYCTLKS